MRGPINGRCAPERLLAVLLAAVGLGPAVPADAKVVSGRTVVAGWQSVVLTKFCFDYQAECKNNECDKKQYPGLMTIRVSSAKKQGQGAKASKMQIEGSSEPEAYVALLDDEYFSFPEVSQVWSEANCSDVLRSSKKSPRLTWSSISTDKGETLEIPVAESLRPRWWYISFVSCSSTSLEMSYSLHLENQQRGWQREFSMDTLGVPLATLFLAVVFCALAVVQVNSLRDWMKQSKVGGWSNLHPAMLLLTFAVVLSALGMLLWTRYFVYYQEYGESLDAWGMLARAAIMSARTSISLLLMFLAHGDCVTVSEIQWDNRKEIAGGQTLFGILSFGLEAWGDSEFRSTTTEYVYDTRAGTVLVAFDILWLWLYASRCLQTFHAETRFKPRNFYRRYGLFLAIWFASLPCVAALARVLAAWVRFRITYFANGFVHSVVLGVLVHTFRPNMAREFYDFGTKQKGALSDEELRSMLGNDDDDDDMI